MSGLQKELECKVEKLKSGAIQEVEGHAAEDQKSKFELSAGD